MPSKQTLNPHCPRLIFLYCLKVISVVIPVENISLYLYRLINIHLSHAPPLVHCKYLVEHLHDPANRSEPCFTHEPIVPPLDGMTSRTLAPPSLLCSSVQSSARQSLHFKPSARVIGSHCPLSAVP